MNRNVEGSGIKANTLSAHQAKLGARIARMGGATEDRQRSERSYTTPGNTTEFHCHSTSLWGVQTRPLMQLHWA